MKHLRHDFTHVHASLLYKVPLRGMRADLDFYRERADVISTTETSQRERSKPFDVEGWDFYRPRGGAGRRQNTITWRTDVFERAGKPFAELLSKTTWRRAIGNHAETPWIWATVVPLRHKATGRKVFVLAAHLPSSVEGNDTREGYTDATPNRVKAHRESLRSLQSFAREIIESEPEAAILLAADWNMNVRRPVVAKWLSKSLSPLGSCWEGRLPKRGTHGKRWGGRVIDGSYVWGLATGAQRVFERRRSDHRAYRTEFAFLDLAPEEPQEPLSRGGNVDAALEAIERALRWNTKHDTKKVGPLTRARDALLEIDPR